MSPDVMASEGSMWTNYGAFRCPGYKGPEGWGKSGKIVTWRGCSYAYNAFGTGPVPGVISRNPCFGLGWYSWVDRGFGPAAYAQSTTTTSVLAPADMVAACDSRLVPLKGVPGTEWLAFDYICVGTALGKWGLIANPERHGKSYNLVFCDAHVEGLEPGRAFDLENSAVRFNNDHQPHPETW